MIVGSRIEVQFSIWVLEVALGLKRYIYSGVRVARAFPGGRVAHLEGQNEEENEQTLRKNKKN